MDTMKVDSSVMLNLLGILENHQIQCEILECPCWSRKFRETNVDGVQIDDEKIAFLGKRRIWFVKIMQEPEEFRLWILEFIEFHIMELIRRELRTRDRKAV